MTEPLADLMAEFGREILKSRKRVIRSIEKLADRLERYRPMLESLAEDLGDDYPFPLGDRQREVDERQQAVARAALAFMNAMKEIGNE